MVILPGAGSAKENHFDFARCCAAGGLAALSFDARGHGASEGVLGAGAIDDVTVMVGLVRGQIGDEATPIALRGSSMGGYLALVAATACRADAVVAICPAPGELLRSGIESGRLQFANDPVGLVGLLDANDLQSAARDLTCPLLLLHAEADESVPVESSRALARVAADCRYVELPGGHHRSIQHDAELQGVAVRFIGRAFRDRGG